VKKILVTGGTGFIGSHVIEAILKNTDWEVTVLDRLDSTSTPRRLTDMEGWNDKGYKDRVKFVCWDLKAPINSFVVHELGEPNYVLHLAASTHVDRSITDPELFVMDNVLGTLHLLQWAKTLINHVVESDGSLTVVGPLEKFNYFSTDEVLGSAPEGVNYKETDMTRPENPYAAAKLGGEALAHAFACTYSMPIFITRTMNVMGERQHPEKFIPMSIRKIRDGEKNILHANKDLTKTGTRFYIHARNVASALLFLLQSCELLKKEDRTKGIYNIVGEKELSNLEVVRLLARFVNEWQIAHGQEVKPLIYELVDFHSSRPGHDLRYALDGTKLKDAGFDYPKTLEESMKKMVDWELEHTEWLDMK
jgi:dTDP-glucose 4,6-dehydratase